MVQIGSFALTLFPKLNSEKNLSSFGSFSSEKLNAFFAKQSYQFVQPTPNANSFDPSFTFEKIPFRAVINQNRLDLSYLTLSKSFPKDFEDIASSLQKEIMLFIDEGTVTTTRLAVNVDLLFDDHDYVISKKLVSFFPFAKETVPGEFAIHYNSIGTVSKKDPKCVINHLLTINQAVFPIRVSDTETKAAPFLIVHIDANTSPLFILSKNQKDFFKELLDLTLSDLTGIADALEGRADEKK